MVHDALEMMLSFAASYLSSFTPITMVMSSPVAGAEMMTFFTVPFRCSLASSALVNLPVDSITTCTPSELQSSFAGLPFGEHADLLAIDGDGIVRRLDVVGQVAQDGVVLQQMGQRLGAGQIVDGYDVNFFVIECGTKNVAADAAKSVDAYLNRHVTSLKYVVLNRANESETTGV